MKKEERNLIPFNELGQMIVDFNNGMDVLPIEKLDSSVPSLITHDMAGTMQLIKPFMVLSENENIHPDIRSYVKSATHQIEYLNNVTLYEDIHTFMNEFLYAAITEINNMIGIVLTEYSIKINVEVLNEKVQAYTSLCKKTAFNSLTQNVIDNITDAARLYIWKLLDEKKESSDINDMKYIINTLSTPYVHSITTSVTQILYNYMLEVMYYSGINHEVNNGFSEFSLTIVKSNERVYDLFITIHDTLMHGLFSQFQNYVMTRGTNPIV